MHICMSYSGWIFTVRLLWFNTWRLNTGDCSLVPQAKKKKKSFSFFVDNFAILIVDLYCSSFDWVFYFDGIRFDSVRFGSVWVSVFVNEVRPLVSVMCLFPSSHSQTNACRHIVYCILYAFKRGTLISIRRFEKCFNIRLRQYNEHFCIAVHLKIVEGRLDGCQTSRSISVILFMPLQTILWRHKIGSRFQIGKMLKCYYFYFAIISNTENCSIDWVPNCGEYRSKTAKFRLFEHSIWNWRFHAYHTQKPIIRTEIARHNINYSKHQKSGIVLCLCSLFSSLLVLVLVLMLVWRCKGIF